MKKIILGITGASGSIYGIKLMEELYSSGMHVHVVTSYEGLKVIEYETEKNLFKHIDEIQKIDSKGKIEYFENDDLFSSIASGSYGIDCMVIAPCSLNTVSCIATGISNTLLLRSAQVALKENKQLLLMPRETPYNTIFLENLTKLSKMGVHILPASPGFYNKPKTIEDMVDFVVGKTLDLLKIENELFDRWK